MLRFLTVINIISEINNITEISMLLIDIKNAIINHKNSIDNKNFALLKA